MGESHFESRPFACGCVILAKLLDDGVLRWRTCERGEECPNLLETRAMFTYWNAVYATTTSIEVVNEKSP